MDKKDAAIIIGLIAIAGIAIFAPGALKNIQTASTASVPQPCPSCQIK